ncbi:hypothetical protein BH11MYX4_BH11MYX4_29940 [soil metagenome]
MTSTSSSLLLALLLCACGGSSTGVGGGGGGGGSATPGPSEPVRLPDGAVVPTALCGDESAVSAAGTWDAVISGSHGSEGSAAITIDASSFVFASGSSTLAFTVGGAGMTLTWKDGTKDLAPVGVTRAASAVDTGILPLGLGGQWTFASDTSGAAPCTASFTGNGFNASCPKVSTPLGRIDGSLVGIRQQEKSSVFGALGGVWHLTAGGSGSIDVTISGNVLTAVGNRPAGSTGASDWITVKLCNGTAAGKTSDGLEIAATRR